MSLAPSEWGVAPASSARERAPGKASPKATRRSCCAYPGRRRSGRPAVNAPLRECDIVLGTHRLDDYAEAFQAAGLAVLVYDHPGFGASVVWAEFWNPTGKRSTRAAIGVARQATACAARWTRLGRATSVWAGGWSGEVGGPAGGAATRGDGAQLRCWVDWRGVG
jgi:hypothetical protein